MQDYVEELLELSDIDELEEVDTGWVCESLDM